MYSQPTQWYLDSGATTHVTTNNNNISQGNQWKPNQVMVGNGQCIQVQGTGNSVIPISPYNLKLNNIVHAPEISHNLLYIHKLSSDNKCRIIFDSQGYVIQDLHTNRTLHRGICHQGLYLLNPSTNDSNGSKVLLSTSSNVELWHRRLGHPNQDMMRHLKS